jgi:hypothetical protein
MGPFTLARPTERAGANSFRETGTEVGIDEHVIRGVRQGAASTEPVSNG